MPLRKKDPISRNACFVWGIQFLKFPKDPAVLKTLRDSELLRRSNFTTPAAIVNHYAIVNLLRRANLLRRSIFSTAGSFGFRAITDAFLNL